MAQVDSENSTAMPVGTTAGAPTADALYFPTDITPEQVFQAWSRKERELLVDLLIDSLNEIDGDPDLEDHGDLEDDGGEEPSLASADARNPTSQEHWTQGNSDEREGDDCADDREDDPADGPEEVNEDGDDNPDDEYSLGWTEQIAQRGKGWFNSTSSDYEQCVPVITEAARQRYKAFDRYGAHRRVRGVDTVRGYNLAQRRLVNLSDRQRAIMAPRASTGTRC